MPTYDYKCQACGHEFEHFQSMKDAPLRKCPKCAKAKLERLIGTGAAVLFKGSGFYQTDYRSDSYKKSAKAESDSSKPAAASADSGAAKPASDAKPSTPVTAPASKPEKSGSKPKTKKD